MIDVQPYLDKLEKLKEKMSAWIDIRVDRERLWDLYKETGILPYIRK